MSKYFTVTKAQIEGAKTFFADEKTFKCLTCVDGNGVIEKENFSVGDSFFVPAGYGEFTVKGNATLIISEVRKYSVCIEIGETFIESKITDDIGNVLKEEKLARSDKVGTDACINELCDNLLSSICLSRAECDVIVRKSKAD